MAGQTYFLILTGGESRAILSALRHTAATRPPENFMLQETHQKALQKVTEARASELHPLLLSEREARVLRQAAKAGSVYTRLYANDADLRANRQALRKLKDVIENGQSVETQGD